MHYYIDGYNLMFRLLSSVDDLKTERESLINRISEKIRLLNLNATIVFDAQYQYGEGTRSLFHTLEVCYTDQGQTADEYILEQLRLSAHPHREIIVTSDSRLAWQARRLYGKTETIKEFLSWLNKRCNKLEGFAKKENPAVAKQLPQLKPSPEKKKEAAIQPEKIIEGSFDYYLYHFEKKLKDAETN